MATVIVLLLPVILQPESWIVDDRLRSGTLPPGLPPPLEALWWLRKGGFELGPEWRKAHEICQTREGEFAYDLVHALVHRVEGDMTNASYWYRRIGGSRAVSIEAEWERIARLLEQEP